MQSGDRLGHFEIQKKLGAGGMGEVYLAVDTRLQRQVAVKILPSALAADADRRARFAQEARAASALKHPNIAHIYDVGEEADVHFIAMEFVEGSDLRERLQGPSLTQTEIIELALQIGGALEEARGKGITHRDIKPANIALTERGEAKVLDFGLARVLADSDGTTSENTMTMGQTMAGTVLGTAQYMSPEQALGKVADTRSDIFSLGVVLYEMATGKAPFAGDSVLAVMEAVRSQAPQAPARFNHELSGDLERIILKCLEKDPEFRYQTPRDLLVDLKALQRASGSQTTVSGVGVRPNRAGSHRLPWLIVPLLVAVGALAFFLAPWQGDDIAALAVLPFENETGQDDVAYLCNGVTEDLINALAQFPELRVISRRSAFAMADRDMTPHAAGRELGVDAILYGRVTQRGDDLVISSELVDARDSRQLWGAKYDRKLADAQSVQHEIVGAVAHKLDLAPSEAGDGPARQEGTENPAAYRMYLKGREYTTGTRREMDRAIDYFQEAIALEPDYALAYAGLGQAYTTQSYLRGNERDETVNLARGAVRQALQLDPDLAEAHTASGMIKMMFDLDWTGAEIDFKRGVALNPGNVVCLVGYGDFLLYNNRIPEALQQYSAAQDRDPLSVGAFHDMAISYMVLKDYAQAEVYFQRAVDVNPNWTWGYIKLAKTYAHMGRTEEALTAAATAEAQLTGSGSPAARCWLAYIYARCGQPDRARRDLADLRQRSADEYVDPSLYAIIYLALDEMEPAIAAFAESLAERSPNLVYYKITPALYLDALGEDARFQELVRKVGYP